MVFDRPYARVASCYVDHSDVGEAFSSLRVSRSTKGEGRLPGLCAFDVTTQSFAKAITTAGRAVIRPQRERNAVG